MSKKGNNKVKQSDSNSTGGVIFDKENYILIGVSILVVLIGFFIMSGTSGDIYDFRRTTVAPIVVVLGFALGIYAIFYRKK